MKQTFVAVLAALALASTARAAGFSIDAHGARATGMATAMVALADDPSAAFYNPAGLLGVERLELAVGDTLIMPRVTFTSPAGDKTLLTGLSPPPHLYARYRVMEGVAAGVGVFVPFGANSSWPEDWEGRFRTTGSSINMWVINPQVAVQLHERVRFGGGLQVFRGTVLLERAFDFLDSEGAVELGGGAWAASFNVGLTADILPKKLTFGASWRPGARMNFDGRAHFSNVPPEFQAVLFDQAVSTSVRLPDMVYAGLGYHPTEQLRLGFDAHYFGWSAFQSLDIEFEQAPASRLPKRWNDTVSLHLGGEYLVTRKWAARAGVVYDPTPSPESTLTPDLPDSDRVKLAVGAGYRLGTVQLDAAYQAVLLTGMDSTSAFFPGRYSGLAHVVGITVGWSLPR